MKNKVLFIASCIVVTHLGFTLTSEKGIHLTETVLPEDGFTLLDYKTNQIDFKLPLLTISGKKGFLASGYINVETCRKNEEACAVVSGVESHQDMLNQNVKAASPEARKLGVKVGMNGKEALKLLK